MKQTTSLRHAKRALTIIAATACVSLTAQAAETEVPARNDGVMSFANVRVETAPVAARAGKAAQPGMTAFIDASTGRLGGPTAEQHAALDAAAKANAAGPAGRRRATPVSDERTTVYGARGGIGAKVDDALMSNAVVTRGFDGRLVHQCMPGEDVAKVHGKATAPRSGKAPTKVAAQQGELK